MARSLRNTFRQSVPRRARWLIRVALRLLSGFYVKRALADWRDLSERVASQSAELEAQSEVLYLLLRRMRTADDELAWLSRQLASLLEQMEDIARRIPPRTVPISEWEPWLADHIPMHGDVFLDVGASTGQYAANLAVGYRSVIAFEPNPQARERLKLSIAGLTHVVVDERAVSSYSGMMKLYLYPDHAQTSALPVHHEAPVDDPIGEITVPCVRLDDIAFAGRVDFLKIDTEGAEVDVTEGAIKTILDHKPRLLVEIHSKENGLAVQSKLKELGYELEVVRHPAYTPQDYYWEQHYWLSCRPLISGRRAVGGAEGIPTLQTS